MTNPLFRNGVVIQLIGAAIGLAAVVAVFYIAKEFGVEGEGSPTSATPPDHAKSIEAARQRWRAGAPSAYSFEYLVDCFCPNAMIWWRVVVEDGKVVGSSILDASAARRRTDNAARPHPTIDSLFDSLEKAAAAHPYMLSVNYDDALHYPRRAFVDPHGMVADDEWTFEIRHLAPVGSADIEIAKEEERRRIENERQKPAPSQLMQAASDLERAGSAEAARRAYVTAARQGNCDAAIRLVDIYRQGLGSIRPDHAESIKWFNAARVLGCEMPLRPKADIGQP